MKPALLCLVVSLTAQAHEIGTTRVSALMQAETYKIEIATDAAALEEKLVIVEGSLDDKFRRRVKLAFDGVESRPNISFSRNSDGGAIIRLTGAIPHGVRKQVRTKE